MQFGVFTVGELTADPVTGHTLSEDERIKVMVTVALKAEEIGLDVFATGEHHNPPFVGKRIHRHIQKRRSRTIDGDGRKAFQEPLDRLNRGVVP